MEAIAKKNEGILRKASLSEISTTKKGKTRKAALKQVGFRADSKDKIKTEIIPYTETISSLEHLQSTGYDREDEVERILQRKEEDYKERKAKQKWIDKEFVLPQREKKMKIKQGSLPTEENKKEKKDTSKKLKTEKGIFTPHTPQKSPNDHKSEVATTPEKKETKNIKLRYINLL